MKAVKRIFRYLKGSDDMCLWYPKRAGNDPKAYSDADFAGYLVGRKSTSGIAHFLGPCLVSWASKKQNSVALSTTEAEYVSAAACCAQILWIKQQLVDFHINITCVPILCDNTSTICISKDPVLHSKTKHIHIRHHFLREHVESGEIELVYCPTENQLADILTKPLSRERFEKIRFELGMIRIF